MKCESCQLKPVQAEELLDKENPPCYLCYDCRQRLISYALRPLEFFNLVAIHGHGSYLHSDFYDYDTGNATQPDQEVVDTEKFPFPRIVDIKNDVQKLVDYACVEYETSDEAVELLRLHDKGVILRYLEKKVEYNRSVNYKAYEVAAKVLGKFAGAWIREEWQKRRKDEIFAFAEAICMCLDFNEAFPLLTAAIEQLEEKEWSRHIFALLHFRHPEILDWIEKVSGRIINISNSWGTLAGTCRFSWQRAEKWLTTGRPLSLIALDALVFCTKRGEKDDWSPWFKKHHSVLIDTPVVAVMEKKASRVPHQG